MTEDTLDMEPMSPAEHEKGRLVEWLRAELVRAAGRRYCIALDALDVESRASLKLTERTLYRLTQDGTLPRFNVGNSWLFRLRDIEAWIEDRKAAGRRERGGR